MIEYVAPTPVATLLEPLVPSVHVVQVPHVHVVQHTIETPQLQILEKSGGFRRIVLTSPCQRLRL